MGLTQATRGNSEGIRKGTYNKHQRFAGGLRKSQPLLPSEYPVPMGSLSWRYGGLGATEGLFLYLSQQIKILPSLAGFYTPFATACKG